tara:strand:+ start:2935 stop:3498 length:564 start_codon:yes stop_codon:yes gene_type:complete
MKVSPRGNVRFSAAQAFRDGVKQKCKTRKKMKSFFKRRGKQRWSALVSAKSSRIAAYVKFYLGENNWKEFVNFANTNYKDQYVSLFAHETLHCNGLNDEQPCPHIFQVKIDNKEDIQCLHLDHKYPVHETCFEWLQSLSNSPKAWNENIDAKELCDKLFSSENLTFRCGPRKGKHMHYTVCTYCHRN